MIRKSRAAYESQPETLTYAALRESGTFAARPIQEATVSTQELQRLQNDAEANSELKASIAQAVSAATDAAGASAVLKARGYDVTEEDLQAVKATELNDDALDSVAGGASFGQNSFLELVFPEYAHDL